MKISNWYGMATAGVIAGPEAWAAQATYLFMRGYGRTVLVGVVLVSLAGHLWWCRRAWRRDHD